jgi:hypothetical protein
VRKAALRVEGFLLSPSSCLPIPVPIRADEDDREKKTRTDCHHLRSPTKTACQKAEEELILPVEVSAVCLGRCVVRRECKKCGKDQEKEEKKREKAMRLKTQRRPKPCTLSPDLFSENTSEGNSQDASAAVFQALLTTIRPCLLDGKSPDYIFFIWYNKMPVRYSKRSR